MLNGEIVEVKSIKGYTGYSIKGIYVPDTVSRIVGGSGTGCFGNISTLKNVVVGKGVTVLEQEVFSMGNGATVEEFIFKSTITSLGNYCMQKMYAKSSDIPYEFDTSLTYVGQKVNYGGNLLREARLQKGCNLSQGYAFNDANGLLSIFIKGGDSASDALDLGAEFASNIGTKYYYISGYVTTSGRAVISGLQGSVIYMESTDAIDVFASAIKSHDYRDRIDDCVFMDCQTQKAWFIDDDADRIEHPSASFSHGGSFVENESTCAQVGTKIETCFVCGATVLSEELEKKEHILDGGVITQMPTNEQGGEIVYSCLICGDSTMIEIAPLSQKHNCETNLEYANGFANSGLEIISCPDCEYTATREIMPIFTALGYSVSDDKTGITCCYRIDNEALEYYESIEGTTKIGFIVADASDVENNGIVDAEYNLKDGVNGLQVLMNDKGYSFRKERKRSQR